MFTGPGCKSGPAWMRNIRDSLADPDPFLLAELLLTHFLTAVAVWKGHNYESFPRVAGLPLISYCPLASGVIAMGARAPGFRARGGITTGCIVFGADALGVASIGRLSVGPCSIPGVALGWPAWGGPAVCEVAGSGLAVVGRYADAGNGIPYRALEASGRRREQLIE